MYILRLAQWVLLASDPSYLYNNPRTFNAMFQFILEASLHEKNDIEKASILILSNLIKHHKFEFLFERLTEVNAKNSAKMQFLLNKDTPKELWFDKKKANIIISWADKILQNEEEWMKHRYSQLIFNFFIQTSLHFRCEKAIISLIRFCETRFGYGESVMPQGQRSERFSSLSEVCQVTNQ